MRMNGKKVEIRKVGGLYKNARVSEEKSLLQSLVMQFNFECIISMHQQ